MSILQKSSADLRQRLLDLFPAANLRKEFEQKGLKSGISGNLASHSDIRKLSAIADFVDRNVQFCKQHVYVLSRDEDATLPESIPSGERVKLEQDHALYLAHIDYEVVEMGPQPTYSSIRFLWPVRIELHQKYLLVRFVVMEKNIGSYFDQKVTVRDKSLSEEIIMGNLLVDGTFGTADLNRGFKALWHQDKIDVSRIRYKEPDSTVTRSMDEEKGLKQVRPEKYEELQRFPLHQSVFIPYKSFKEVGSFAADPTSGVIGFTRYFKEGASGNELIRQILKNN